MQITFSGPLSVAPSRDVTDLSADAQVSDTGLSADDAIFTLTPAPGTWQPIVVTGAPPGRAKAPLGIEAAAILAGRTLADRPQGPSVTATSESAEPLQPALLPSGGKAPATPITSRSALAPAAGPNRPDLSDAEPELTPRGTGPVRIGLLVKDLVQQVIGDGANFPDRAANPVIDAPSNASTPFADDGERRQVVAVPAPTPVLTPVSNVVSAREEPVASPVLRAVPVQTVQTAASGAESIIPPQDRQVAEKAGVFPPADAPLPAPPVTAPAPATDRPRVPLGLSVRGDIPVGADRTPIEVPTLRATATPVPEPGPDFPHKMAESSDIPFEVRVLPRSPGLAPRSGAQGWVTTPPVPTTQRSDGPASDRGSEIRLPAPPVREASGGQLADRAGVPPLPNPPATASAAGVTAAPFPLRQAPAVTPSAPASPKAAPSPAATEDAGTPSPRADISADTSRAQAPFAPTGPLLAEKADRPAGASRFAPDRPETAVRNDGAAPLRPSPETGGALRGPAPIASPPAANTLSEPLPEGRDEFLPGDAPDTLPGTGNGPSELQRRGAPGDPPLQVLARGAAAQIAEAVRTPFDGSVEVRLSPEELGRVRVTMVPGEAGLVVHLVAERPETLDLLRRHADLLAHDLRDAGYEGLEFSFGREGRQERPQPETGPNPRGVPLDGPALPDPTATPRARPAIAGAGIDIRL
jgi:hypothetical protein